MAVTNDMTPAEFQEAKEVLSQARPEQVRLSRDKDALHITIDLTTLVSKGALPRVSAEERLRLLNSLPLSEEDSELGGREGAVMEKSGYGSKTRS
jgi:hypothetical protein